MNSEFIANIKAIYGYQGDEWLSTLSAVVTRLRFLWNLDSIEIVKDLTYNYCFFAKRPDGQKVVAKIACDPKQHSKEVLALKAFASGVPKIIEIDAHSNAYLMERFAPGDSAKAYVQAGNDDEATRIVARSIAQLKRNGNVDGFMHLSAFIPSLDLLKERIPLRSFEKLRTTFLDLTSDRAADVVLHGDLHHGNVLSHGSRWLAIDPHGYLGHPVAEIGAMIRNPWDAFPSDRSLRDTIDRRIRILHEELSFDVQLMNAWAHCITALSEVWSIQDQGPGHSVDMEMFSTLEARVK